MHNRNNTQLGKPFIRKADQTFGSYVLHAPHGDNRNVSFKQYYTNTISDFIYGVKKLFCCKKMEEYSWEKLWKN